MVTMKLGIGTRITHPKFGDGVIIEDAEATTYIIYFEEYGEKEIAKDFDGLVVVRLVERDPDAISLDDVKRIMNQLIEPLIAPQSKIDLGEKWEKGKLILVPGREGLQSKEIPIETFFHKIVMTRDRLRVMEQKINSSNLSESEKIELQQYLTRIYGSLTTFNVLFDNKEDYFKGTSSK